MGQEIIDPEKWGANMSESWVCDLDDIYGLLTLPPRMIAMGIQVAQGFVRAKGATPLGKYVLNTHLALKIIYLSLLHEGLPILGSDLIQLVEKGIIPYYTVWEKAAGSHWICGLFGDRLRPHGVNPRVEATTWALLRSLPISFRFHPASPLYLLRLHSRLDLPDTLLPPLRRMLSIYTLSASSVPKIPWAKVVGAIATLLFLIMAPQIDQHPVATQEHPQSKLGSLLAKALGFDFQTWASRRLSDEWETRGVERSCSVTRHITGLSESLFNSTHPDVPLHTVQDHGAHVLNTLFTAELYPRITPIRHPKQVERFNHFCKHEDTMWNALGTLLGSDPPLSDVPRPTPPTRHSLMTQLLGIHGERYLNGGIEGLTSEYSHTLSQQEVQDLQDELDQYLNMVSRYFIRTQVTNVTPPPAFFWVVQQLRFVSGITSKSILAMTFTNIRTISSGPVERNTTERRLASSLELLHALTGIHDLNEADLNEADDHLW